MHKNKINKTILKIKENMYYFFSVRSATIIFARSNAGRGVIDHG